MAIIIRTFVDGLTITLFPEIERRLTMRAPIFGNGTMTLAELKKFVTDFAANLGALLAIVKIQIVGGCLTTRASDFFGNLQSRLTMLNRRERMTVFAFKSREPFLPI